MQFQPGTRLGAYEIHSFLAAGGMGEVYRARDTRLGRDVALKTLPAGFTSDPERVARFRREAQLLASLNHPNIAAIHGLEEADSAQFLVLELVEGETLDARLRREGTGMALDEAFQIARQIADALEAAHEKGVVHRDLKPANVAVTPDGQVKVLDFGLAKLQNPDESQAGTGVTHSPTITFAHTQAGVILGTAAYMSPEQARGRVADKRSDVWAFGCVLYELLTGRRAFDGEDVTDVIAAVVRGEPDWSAVPPAVPEQIRLLLKRCLEKDRRARISDIAVARFLMTETITPTSAGGARGFGPPPRGSRSIAIPVAVGITVGIALAAGAFWQFERMRPRAQGDAVRFSLTPPSGQPLVLQGADRNIDVAPDGAFIVYRGFGQVQPELFIRPLNVLDARPLVGGTDVRSPFISTDGRWIGYFAGTELRKVLATGGPPVTICRVSGAPRGATWLPDDSIVFAVADSRGLRHVPASGGEPTIIAAPAAGETGALLLPSALPNGRGVLYTVGTGASWETGQIAVLDIKTGQRKTLIHGGGQAHYVGGYLVYAAGEALRAARFDLDTLTVVGDPVPVAEGVLSSNSGATNFAISRNGSLVYVPSSVGAATAAPRTLVWVDRKGQETPIGSPARAFSVPRLSPDGTRIAVDSRDQQSDIWIWDLARATLTRLTFEAGVDQTPVWTPDSRSIVWSSQRSGGTPNVYRQAADGTGTAEQLASSTNPQFPTAIHPDGNRVVIWENSGTTSQDIALLDLSAPAASDQRRAQPLVHTNAVELGGTLSFDGRWLAYQSSESGQAEVYVRPFPNVDAGRWQVSTAGGTRPAWAASGKEMFYLDGGGYLTTVPVQTAGPSFNAGVPAKLLQARYYPGFTGLGLDVRGYDVSRDGQRFLMVKEMTPAPGSANPRAAANMVVVVNWLEELKARVPAK